MSITGAHTRETDLDRFNFCEDNQRILHPSMPGTRAYVNVAGRKGAERALLWFRGLPDLSDYNVPGPLESATIFETDDFAVWRGMDTLIAFGDG